MGQRAEKSWCEGPERSELGWGGRAEGRELGLSRSDGDGGPYAHGEPVHFTLGKMGAIGGVVTTLTRSDLRSTKISLAAMVRLG